MKKLIWFFLAAVLITAAVAGIAGAGPKTGPNVGQQAPDFKLKSVTGADVALSALRDKPVFLNFWATWCPPCRAEMPDLQAMYKKYGSRMHFLAVNVQESTGEVTGFLKSNKYTFPVVLDNKGSVTGKYFVNGIPTSLVIDTKGVIQGKNVGALSASQLEALIRKVLK